MKTFSNPTSMRAVLFITILAGLAVVGLNLVAVRPKLKSLRTELQAQTQLRKAAESGLADAKAELSQITVQLRQNDSIVADARAGKVAALAKATEQGNRAEALERDLVTAL